MANPGEGVMGVLKLIIKKYPWVFMAPLIGGIILVGVSTGYTMYRAFSYKPPAVPQGTEEDKHAPESRPLLDHYAVISQRDLFASALSGAEERVEAEGDNVRAPTVSFKLMGTVVVSPGVSAAIIEDPATREQELFHENDMVQGVKIVKILRNKVIVDKDGYEEVVEVVEETPRTSSTPPVQQPRRVQRPPVRRPVKVQPPTEKQPAR
jgi:type II secretory pathway component PulC